VRLYLRYILAKILTCEAIAAVWPRTKPNQTAFNCTGSNTTCPDICFLIILHSIISCRNDHVHDVQKDMFFDQIAFSCTGRSFRTDATLAITQPRKNGKMVSKMYLKTEYIDLCVLKTGI